MSALQTVIERVARGESIPQAADAAGISPQLAAEMVDHAARSGRINLLVLGSSCQVGPDGCATARPGSVCASCPLK